MTDMRPELTRIPDVPNQRDFLDRWYEFHQGYRIVKNEDGSEAHQAVIGEPWEDVSPGHLPRTLDELRSGAQRSAADQPQQIEIQSDPITNGPSLDEEFDRLIEEADRERPVSPVNQRRQLMHATRRDSQDERVDGTIPSGARREGRGGREPTGRGNVIGDLPSHRRVTRVSGQAMHAHEPTRQQLRRTEALQRELARLQRGMDRVTDALAEAGRLPDTVDSVARLARLSLPSLSAALPDPPDLSRDTPLEQRLAAQHAWIDSRRALREQAHRDQTVIDAHIERARAERARVSVRLGNLSLDVVQGLTQLQRLRSERTSAENFRRVFGTREDMERDGWVSPIHQMFSRAYERYSVAEQARQGPAPETPSTEESRSTIYAPTPLQDPAGGVVPGSLAQDVADNENDPEVQRLLERYFAGEGRRRGQVEGDGANDGMNVATRRPFSVLPPTLPTGNWFLPPDFPLDPTTDPIISRVSGRTTSTSTSGAGGGRHAHPASTSETASTSASSLSHRHHHNNNHHHHHHHHHDHNHRHRHRHHRHHGSGRGDDQQPYRGGSLDAADDDRPEPKTDEDTTVKLDCKVCFAQVADVACLPCGHVVMCRWCAEQHVPSLRHDRITPRTLEPCAVCRRTVRERLRLKFA